jgi:sterol desaturase/sphingolipid hydroxylase (fatty acid hydroxylase superfamily)
MLVVFGTIAGLFFVAERLFPRRQQPLLRAGLVADACYVPVHYLLRVAISVVAAGTLTSAADHLVPGRGPLLEGLPAWQQAVVVLVVLDALFYAMHRLKHASQWWWRLHETHHSSMQLDFLASARFHPLEKVLDRLIFLLPLTLLGPSAAALLIWSSVDVFLGMLNHANVRWRLGPLAYVLVTPDLHRRHHARDAVTGDCNFGNNFSIFDWLFGTARLVREDPPAFGIEAHGYPQESLLRQLTFAFRRGQRRRRVDTVRVAAPPHGAAWS